MANNNEANAKTFTQSPMSRCRNEIKAGIWEEKSWGSWTLLARQILIEICCRASLDVSKRLSSLMTSLMATSSGKFFSSLLSHHIGPKHEWCCQPKNNNRFMTNFWLVRWREKLFSFGNLFTQPLSLCASECKCDTKSGFPLARSNTLRPKLTAY